MLLMVRDRLTLLEILPREGQSITLLIVMELLKQLGFTEIELSILNFEQTDKGLKWDELPGPVEVPIGEVATKIITDRFKQLDKQGKLKLFYMPTFKLFVKE